MEISYKRPPITEAVIERRFSVPLSHDLLDKLRQKYEHEFQAVTEVMEIALVGGPTPQMKPAPTGFRMVNREGTAIVMVTHQTIAYSTLAPYPGWATFSAAAAAIFKSAHGIMGYSPIERLGVRYINRLDIPITANADGTFRPFELEEYILIRPDYPDGVLPSIEAFTTQCVFFIAEIDCSVTINVASVISPVPRHVSFLFDIDIGRMKNVPQKEPEIETLLNNIRQEKNRLFNACLTSKMKGMFD